MLNWGSSKHFLFSNRATRRALQLAALLLMTAGSGAMAAEWYAAPNGSGSDCTQASPCTIQGAIDRAGEYDTVRSEEHTSELQSRGHLVCRLLLEQKNK